MIFKIEMLLHTFQGIRQKSGKFKYDSCFDMQTQDGSVLKLDNNFLLIEHKRYKDLHYIHRPNFLHHHLHKHRVICI